jgi:hypothetical protein
MKRIIETFNKSLMTSNEELGEPDKEERICLNRDAFDRMIDTLADDYEKYKEMTLQEGGTCIPFERWLKIQNSWSKASKGSLNKD